MLDSFMFMAGALVLLAVAAFVLNPLIALVPLLLLFALVGLKAGGRLFKHAGAAPTASDNVAHPGPTVPTTQEAAYNPVSDPGVH